MYYGGREHILNIYIYILVGPSISCILEPAMCTMYIHTDVHRVQCVIKQDVVECHVIKNTNFVLPFTTIVLWLITYKLMCLFNQIRKLELAIVQNCPVKCLFTFCCEATAACTSKTF